jgi:hypothetical protein
MMKKTTTHTKKMIKENKRKDKKGKNPFVPALAECIE